MIGRLVTPEALERVYEGLGVNGAPALSHQEAWSAVRDRGAVLDLAGGMQIRRSLLMGAHRVELAGFSDGAVPQLKALGLVSEIIAWRLRLFVPTAKDRGPDSRKVAQVVFKPDWNRDRNAAPFKRNDRMLEALPIGVVVFPGSGISANLADKARKIGIPTWRFDQPVPVNAQPQGGAT